MGAMTKKEDYPFTYSLKTDYVPYIPHTYTPECGDNLAPAIPMIISFFIGFVLMIFCILIRYIALLIKSRRVRTSKGKETL
ncbi:unnamed protein product [Blepharisma stoltei]|uniref:Uncharacterized protein n=1 Tax=Blepharisma stoltei TaxID=1481888 RepID=A0AAU9K7W9_9CILI|nr:unnamed protein product [Blepharisma stoltei]